MSSPKAVFQSIATDYYYLLPNAPLSPFFTRFPTDFTISLPNAPFSLFLASVSHVLRSFPVPRLELSEFWVPVALESHKSSPKAVFHPIPTGSSFSLPNTPFSQKIAWFRTVWAVFGLHVCTFYNFLSLTTFGPDCMWYCRLKPFSPQLLVFVSGSRSVRFCIHPL
jgi:hypothetical protein